MTYHYNTKCSLGNLKNIRKFIRDILTSENIPEELLGIVVLAMDEVCSNIMIHAHGCNPSHSIEMSIHRPSKELLVFEVIDEGKAFNINEFQEPAVEHLIHTKKRGGLGIRLVKSIMDKIEYDIKKGKNVCRLIKKIPNTSY